MLEAFFGLDDALPVQALGLCSSAVGADGMPVTFTHRLLSDQPPVTAFRVITASRATKVPSCATTRPANESSENHTVLLIGDLGSAADPPVRVEIVSPLSLVGAAPEAAVGLEVAVTALADGPRLVLAFPLTRSEGLDCPSSAAQGIAVVWAGGVVPATGKDDDDHRRAYEVDVDDGSVVPAALGDLNDNDNYVHLCLDLAGVPRSVHAVAGVVVDPAGDANVDSRVDVAGRAP